ncbi:MAG: phosphatidylserine decarboxylase family protein [Bergeyella sp.]|nr:phosphatidylserine decarboxylase family protein [Bergeyella sp.]
MKLHREGKSTLIIAGLTLISISILAFFLLKGWAFLVVLPLVIVYGFILWFFRVPVRKIGSYTKEVIAPVDGKVVMIKEVEETEFLNKKVIQISIFMSPLNVHICRYPVTGKVIYEKYHPGKYLVAWHEKSSTENERSTLAVETQDRHKVVFRQIAGYIARRIVYYSKRGDEAKAGHEMGFIKFGSRMDVFLPLGTQVTCKIGELTKGGINIIAKLQ